MIEVRRKKSIKVVNICRLGSNGHKLSTHCNLLDIEQVDLPHSRPLYRRRFKSEVQQGSIDGMAE